MLKKKIFLSFLFYLLTNGQLSSLELNIKCKISNSKNYIHNNKVFTKEIDLKNKSLLKESGLLFDEIISFTENEIHFKNDTYETYSVYDLSSGIWTVYSNSKIDIYYCD